MSFFLRIIVVFLWSQAFFPFAWGSVAMPYAKDKSFAVIIPSYNNKEWYKRNLDSVFSQSYGNFRVIYVDDASLDGTGTLVRDYIEKNGLRDRATLIQNEIRVGALANIYHGIWLCSPHEIVVNLDGDDWLAHRHVFTQLNEIYADRDVWLTYGQFIYYPNYAKGIGAEIPQRIIEQNAFRSFNQGTTALRTFYAGLFQQIQHEDLLYEGSYLKVSYDLGIMLPMLEMAGKHSKFIPDVSYVYNVGTLINDYKVNGDEQVLMDRYLRSKERYQPIDSYNVNHPMKKIYITPGLWGQLFDINNPIFNRDNCLDVLYELREIAAEAGYALEQADSLENLGEFEYLIVFDIFTHQLPYLSRYPKEKLIAFLWEPPSVIPENYQREYHDYFSKVYTWNDSLVDGKKYFKFFYPVLRPMISSPIGYHWKRLSTLIACNKDSSFPNELYSERRKVIRFFEDIQTDDFDLFGKWWPSSLKNYQGPIEKKVDCLKYYKFCFAYENVKDIPGYITEKIFDCFQAGTVPIYWGASNILDHVPKDCCILREQFDDDAALYQYLKDMTEAQYVEYIDNIRLFLGSEKAQLYSTRYFIRTVMNLIMTLPSSEENSTLSTEEVKAENLLTLE